MILFGLGLVTGLALAALLVGLLILAVTCQGEAIDRATVDDDIDQAIANISDWDTAAQKELGLR